MNRARKLSEKLKNSGRQPFVTMDYGDVQTVRDDGTLDVTVEGGTLSGIKMTTACSGVTVGDRVIVETSGNLSTVTGIVYKPDAARKRFFTGSKVVNPNGGDSAILFTNSEIKEMCGREFNPSSDFVGIMNGDGYAQGTHMEGATYMSTDNAIHACFSTSFNGSVRVNWLIAFNK